MCWVFRMDCYLAFSTQIFFFFFFNKIKKKNHYKFKASLASKLNHNYNCYFIWPLFDIEERKMKRGFKFNVTFKFLWHIWSLIEMQPWWNLIQNQGPQSWWRRYSTLYLNVLCKLQMTYNTFVYQFGNL